MIARCGWYLTCRARGSHPLHLGRCNRSVGGGFSRCDPRWSEYLAYVNRDNNNIFQLRSYSHMPCRFPVYDGILTLNTSLVVFAVVSFAVKACRPGASVPVCGAWKVHTPVLQFAIVIPSIVAPS